MKGVRVGYPGTKLPIVHLLYNAITKATEVEKGEMADSFAGSGNVALFFAQQGWRIFANDLCFYSYTILKSLGNKNSHIVVSQARGLFTEQFGKLNRDLTTVVDGVALEALHRRDFRVLASLGYALVSSVTYRGVQWDRRAIARASVTRLLDLIRQKVRQLPFASGIEAYNLNVTEFHEKIPHVDVIYMDPAWPWKNGSQANQYLFLMNKLSSILAQRRFSHRLATRVDIWALLDNWLSSAEAKADFIAISTQSTNYPSPRKLESFLARRYKLRERAIWKRRGSLRKKNVAPVLEYLFVVEVV